MIWLYIEKTMYRYCELALWLMKVNFFGWIDFDSIHVLYEFQSDISTISWEIKYQNIEKSPSLIIERLVSMATKKIDLTEFHKKVLPWFSDLNTSTVKKSGRLHQYCGLYIVQWQKNRQTDKPRWPIYFTKSLSDFRKVITMCRHNGKAFDCVHSINAFVFY